MKRMSYYLTTIITLTLATALPLYIAGQPATQATGYEIARLNQLLGANISSMNKQAFKNWQENVNALLDALAKHNPAVYAGFQESYETKLQDAGFALAAAEEGDYLEGVKELFEQAEAEALQPQAAREQIRLQPEERAARGYLERTKGLFEQTKFKDILNQFDRAMIRLNMKYELANLEDGKIKPATDTLLSALSDEAIVNLINDKAQNIDAIVARFNKNSLQPLLDQLLAQGAKGYKEQYQRLVYILDTVDHIYTLLSPRLDANTINKIKQDIKAKKQEITKYITGL